MSGERGTDNRLRPRCPVNEGRTIGYVPVVPEEAKRASQDGIALFDDDFASHMHALLNRQDALEELGDPSLLPFLRRLGPGHSDEVRSLYVYLLSGCNISKASKRLYMHRSTLEYRIDKICGDCHIDFPGLSVDETLRMILTCVIYLEGDGAAENGAI